MALEETTFNRTRPASREVTSGAAGCHGLVVNQHPAIRCVEYNRLRAILHNGASLANDRVRRRWRHRTPARSLRTSHGGATIALAACPPRKRHMQAVPKQLERAIAAGGETGALVRRLDWSRTPLGPMKDWPTSLRISVSTCLTTGFPMALNWGPEPSRFTTTPPSPCSRASIRRRWVAPRGRTSRSSGSSRRLHRS